MLLHGAHVQVVASCLLLHVVACCCMLLHVVACCYMLLHVVACCCMLLHVASCCMCGVLVGTSRAFAVQALWRDM
jgi:hypothetical protein